MKSQRLPNLGSLRVFEVAARRGSFVAAAGELNVTHGAVSKQIQALEQDLGTALFERRNRGVHLTRQGQWLSVRLSGTFAELEGIIAEFRALYAVPGPLTVSCEPTLCLRFLIPALGDLKNETGLDIRVLAAGGPIDFRAGHVDIAIRRSDFPIPPGVETVGLAAEWMGPVATVGLALRDRQAPARLHSDSRPAAWPEWTGKSGIVIIGPDIRYEHFYLAIQAAEAGLGMAMASIHMVAPDLRTERLRAPHGFSTDGTHYAALRPAGVVDERLQALIAWLVRRMEENAVLAASMSGA